MSMNREKLVSLLQEWRGVQDPCDDCQGSGVKSYSSTALWRSGIGGQAFTSGVCDKCWGSGDKHRPWVDLRKLEAQRDEVVREAAETYITGRLGSRYYTKAIFQQVVDVLRAQTRKRKISVEYKQLCDRLANVLVGMGKE